MNLKQFDLRLFPLSLCAFVFPNFYKPFRRIKPLFSIFVKQILLFTLEQIAIIDLGTNTFHLLIVSVKGSDYQILYSEKVAVRIGKGGINEGFITDEAANRAINTLQYFNAEIQERGIKKVVATATSAFRNAKNGNALAESIKAKTGISISIISGDREAELIYFGVKEALQIGKEKALIVDIGGGSVEFIIANDDELFWKQSFEIGGQRMIERFQKTDPIKPEAILELNSFLTNSLEPLRTALKTFPTKTIIGSSGSFDTFSEMVLRKKGYQYSIETKTEYEISLKDFSILYDEIVFNDREARLALPGMIDLRVDMIVVGTILVRHLLDSLNLNRIRVSTYALKEGVLSAVINEKF